MSEENRSLRSGSFISRSLFYGTSKRDSSSESEKDISISDSDNDSDYCPEFCDISVSQPPGPGSVQGLYETIRSEFGDNDYLQILTSSTFRGLWW